MSVLLDSHAFVWWAAGKRMDAGARRRIDRDGAIISAVTAWELSIKQAMGRVRFARTIDEYVDEMRAGRLDITFQHAQRAAQLPMHHRDPFDRMLVAQAQIEDLAIVTRDPAFDAYDVEVVHC